MVEGVTPGASVRRQANFIKLTYFLGRIKYEDGVEKPVVFEQLFPGPGSRCQKCVCRIMKTPKCLRQACSKAPSELCG